MCAHKTGGAIRFHFLWKLPSSRKCLCWWLCLFNSSVWHQKGEGRLVRWPSSEYMDMFLLNLLYPAAHFGSCPAKRPFCHPRGRRWSTWSHAGSKQDVHSGWTTFGPTLWQVEHRAGFLLLYPYGFSVDSTLGEKMSECSHFIFVQTREGWPWCQHPLLTMNHLPPSNQLSLSFILQERDGNSILLESVQTFI